jgi:SET domain
MNIPPVLIEIRPSQMLKGQVGLFAVRDMQAGTEIISGRSFEETFEPWDSYESLDDETQRKADAFCVTASNGIWMPRDFNLMPISYFMNHNCDPNVGFNKDGGFVVFRDVKAGEELSFDYGIAFSDPRFRLECKCGSADCRGLVTGNDWQLPDLQVRYSGFFMWEVQEKINAMRGQ